MSSVLTRRHILAQERLRSAAATGTERIWRALPGYDRENVDEWLARVLPLVNAAQRRSAGLTNAYIAAFLGRAPLALDLGKLTGAGVRNGTTPQTVYERPFVTLWSKLGAGEQFASASAAALARATSTAAMDVQLSMRATSNAVQETDDGIYGYQRVPDGGACSFCSEVSGAYVKSADAMPLHNNCGCGLEPLTAPHPRAAQLPSGVAVSQHGELGPVLHDPAHDFTSETDI